MYVCMRSDEHTRYICTAPYAFRLFACNHIDHGGDGDGGARDDGDCSLYILYLHFSLSKVVCHSIIGLKKLDLI